MKAIPFILFLLGMLLLPAYGKEPSQSFDLQQARKMAFQKVQWEIDTTQYSARDPDFAKNRQALPAKAKGPASKRYITAFDTGDYVVSSLGSNTGFHYSADGELESISISSIPFNPKGRYPFLEFKYEYPSGRLFSVAVHTRFGEAYYFYPDEALAAHCIMQNCYAANGKLESTRTLIHP